MDISKIKIEFMPKITDDQLWDFYVRNAICEVGYGKEDAVKPLRFHPYYAAALYEDKLLGIIRGLFDGLSVFIAEACLECELQGEKLNCNNGSVIEKDNHGIFNKMCVFFLEEMRKMGNTFTTHYVIEGAEEKLWQSIGLTLNEGHLAYYKDERPYVQN